MVYDNNIQAVPRSDDENHDSHDHIPSQSATPSGARTPRPDPSDKRLPGIMHNFFGQVGTKSITASLIHHTPLASMLEVGAGKGMEQHHGKTSFNGALPTAPSTPEPDANSATKECQQTLVGKSGALSLSDNSTCLNVSDYPTPPVSSSSSFVQKEVDSDESPGSKERSPEGNGAEHPLKERKKSAANVLPLSSRQRTAGLKSLSGTSGIIASPSVHTAHLSNPTTAQASTAPSSPTHKPPPASALSSLTASYLELSKLTDNVALAPRKKSTPPLTPRALSASGTDGAPRSPAPNSKLQQSTASELPSISTQPHPTKPIEDTINPADIKPPKGKLFIKISEARGLKPSHDPYVVCVFEWTEYISNGPKAEKAEKEREEPREKDTLFGGMPIKRSGSDMGRSIAIPMKSRQNSTTSLNDQKGLKTGKQVTDPKWEHEATL